MTPNHLSTLSKTSNLSRLMNLKSKNPPSEQHTASLHLWALSIALLLWTSSPSASDNTLSVACYGPYNLKMDANRASYISNMYIVNEVFDPLVFIGVSGRLTPGGAESWEISPDGKIYRFFLNPNARWSDGQPVVAQNYVDGWRRCMHWEQDCIQSLFQGIEDSNKRSKKSVSNQISGLIAKDLHTLVVKLEKPNAIDIATFSNVKFSPFPSHLNIPFDQLWSSEPGYVSNGPMKIQSASAEKIEFVPNEHYSGPQPTSFDKMLYTSDPSGKTSLPQYIRNDIQGICRMGDGQNQWISKHLPNDKFPLPHEKSAYLGLNLKHPELQKTEVRMGLYLAVEKEREKLLKQLDDPSIRPLRGIVPENYPGYHSMMDSYSEILARYPKALASLNGLKLSLSFIDRPTLRIVARFLQRAWHQHGVDLEVNFSHRPISEQIHQMTQGKVDMVFTAWSPDFSSPKAYLDLLEGDTPLQYASFLRNSGFQEALQRSSSKLNAESRFEEYAKTESSVFHQKMPLIGLFSRRTYVMLKPDIQPSTQSGEILLRFGALKSKADSEP